MQAKQMKYVTILLTLLLHVTRSDSDGNGDQQEPRAKRRIVKLYPGVKREPVKCTEEGFLADPFNCTLFYQCVLGKKGNILVFRHQCGPGTIFDPENNICNHPRSTNRKKCSEYLNALPIRNNEIDIVKDELYNNWKHEFTKEVDPSTINAWKSQTTDSYLTLNTGLDKTANILQELPKPLKDDFFSIRQTTSQLSANHDATVTTDIPYTTPFSIKTSKRSISHQQLVRSENICVIDGFIGDSENCKLFYRCVSNGRGGFNRYDYSCSDSTVWDDEISACNHPWAVTKQRCKGYYKNNDNSISTSEFFSPSTNKNEEVFGLKETPLQIQISKDQSEINDVHVANNSINLNSKQNKNLTNDDLKLDPKKTQINHSNNDVQMGQIQITQSPTQLYESSRLTTIRQKDLQHNTHLVPDNTICSESGFVGDKNNCKIFYRCVDNGKGSFIKYEFTCGDGTVWDQQIEGCNHAWAVKECASKIPNKNINISSLTTPSVPNYQTTSESIIFETDEFGKDNNQLNQSNPPMSTTVPTMSKPISTTSELHTNVPICKTDGFLGDKSNCKKFYRCVDNGKGGFIKYEYSCGEGTLWDTSIEACNHAWAVKNCDLSSLNNLDDVRTTTLHETLTTAMLITTTTQKSFSGHDYETDNGQSQQNSQSGENSFSNSSTTTITTSNPINEYESLNKCTSSGFMADKNDCKKFYRCVDNDNNSFIRYEFICGDGTIWDQNIESCNHEYLGSNCKFSTTHSQHNEPVVISTIQPTTKYQNYSQNEMSTTSTMAPESTQSLHEEASIMQTRPNSDEKTKNQTCNSEGFYANSYDCKKFYRCVKDGKGTYFRYDFVCGEGTVWDQEIQACNHVSGDKNCSNIYSDIMPENAVSNNQSMTSMTSTTETQYENTTSIVIDDNECTTDGFFSYLKDCRKFYRCVNNGNGGYTKYDFICGEGTVWVQEIQACDHDNNAANCSTQSGTENSSSQTNEQTQESTSLTTIVTSSTSQRPYEEYSNGSSTPSTTSMKCMSEGFYPNENNCIKFYRCVDNGQGGFTAYEFTCGDGTAWDSSIRSCNHIGNVQNCQSVSNNSSTEATISDQQQQTTETTTKPIIDSSKPNTVTCQEEGYYGDYNDCKKFYRCVDNGNGGYIKYEYNCGEGTIWDQDITACNHLQDVANPSCKNNAIESTSTQSSSPQNSPTQSSSTQSSSAQSTSTQSISSQSPSTQSTPMQSSTSEKNSVSQPTSTTSTTSEQSNAENSSSCDNSENQNFTCTKAGYYANPSDCKKFYRCVDWDGNGKRFSIYHYVCGEGTIWDPQLETCNYEESIYPPRKCKGQQTQSQNNTQETMSTSTTEGSTSTTTTQRSTTKSTTEKSTTNQPTTVSQPTSENTTTEQAPSTQQTITTETTTTDLTTEKTTTQQSTTSEPKTTEMTTSGSTPIANSTTEQTTSSESTTQYSTTTDESTTQQSSTEKNTTVSQPTSENTTTEQGPSTQQTTITETTTTDLTTTEKTTTQQTTSEPKTTEMTTSGSTPIANTTTEQTTSSESTTIQSSTTTDESTTQQSSTEKSTTESTTGNSTQESTTVQQTTTTELSTTQSTTSKEELTTQKSTTEKSTTQESTTQQSTTEVQTEENTSTTESTTSETECPETSDDQFIFVCPTSFKRHPKYCNLFYQCTENDDTHEANIATFRCPNNTIYDENKVQCVEENKANKKCSGKIAKRTKIKRLDLNFNEPIIVGRNKHKCLSEGHFPFERDFECSSAFLKCQKSRFGDIKGTVFLCPPGYVYWSISRRCEPNRKIIDCKSSSNRWKNRNIPFETQNIST